MESKISNLINMDKSFLEKLSKSELIELLLQKNEIIDDKPRPVPTPRKSVKDMVQQYEEKPSEKPVPEKRTTFHNSKKP